MKYLIEDKAKEQKTETKRMEKRFENIEDRIKGLQDKVVSKFSAVDNTLTQIAGLVKEV